MTINQSKNKQFKVFPKPQEQNIRERAKEISKFRNKGSDQDNWYAAIEELESERSIPNRIERILNYPDRLIQEILLPFGNPKHRFFALETTKTIISAVSLTATVIAGIGLFLNYYNANERLITERFSKAVEQLGSDKIETRLGGIYALERISKDSEKDYWTIIEILTAFVREHAKLPPEKSVKPITLKNALTTEAKDTADKTQAPTQAEKERQTLSPPTDIQAVLTVLSRRAHTPFNTMRKDDTTYISFGKFQISSVNLPQVNLQYANLFNAYLQYANLTKSHLQYANLHYANLENTNLYYANFSGADLQDANLSGANLSGANLSGADLKYTDLRDADLQDTNLGCLEIGHKICTNLNNTKNLTIVQIKTAKNWQQACYDLDFRKQLGLPPENPKNCADKNSGN